MHGLRFAVFGLVHCLLSLALSKEVGTVERNHVLSPIKLHRNSPTAALRQRSSENFSDLDLQTQSELIFGSPGDKGQMILANMTLYAPDGLRMIMMESFEGLTSAVDCKGDDGTMSLTFKTQSAFEYALKTWAFVNEKDEYKFLLIANHDGCGPDDNRQPYYITRVTEDVKDRTTFLAAKQAPWSEVAGSYNLDFGRLPQSSPQVHQKRKRIDESKTFSINAGTPGKEINIYKAESGEFALDCMNCYIQGNIEIAGHVKTHFFSIKEFTITASPKDFQAKLELKAKATVKTSPAPLQYPVTLFEGPIPDAGIEIPGIFKLGAILAYEIGVGASLKGDAEFEFGLDATLPDTALLKADIHNPGDSSAVGFQGSLTPVFRVDKLDASTTVSAYAQPKLTFGIDVVKILKAEVAMSLKLPELSATLEATYDETGACSHGDGASKTGVTLSSEAAVKLDLSIDVGINEGTNTKPLWSKELVDLSQPLFQKCFPIDIPGLRGSHTTQSAPALPSATGAYPLGNATNPTPSGSIIGPGPTGTGIATLQVLSPSAVSHPMMRSGKRDLNARDCIRGPCHRFYA